MFWVAGLTREAGGRTLVPRPPPPGVCTIDKNLIEFQKGLSLADFLAQYGTEAQCADALFGWRCQAVFVAAVAKNDKGYPIALRISVVARLRKTELAHGAAEFIHSDSIVVSDGLACFRGIPDAGIEHHMLTGSGAGDVELPERQWVNTILGNVKTAMRGTYRQASPQHSPRYLAEFCYRFNRRCDLAAMLPRLGDAATWTPPMPYRMLKLAQAW